MQTWAWYNNTGTAWVNFSAGNMIGFYGTATYGAKTAVSAYQGGMHLRTAAGTDTDACAAPHCDNVKYINATYCDINGAGDVDVATIGVNDCVRIEFTDGATSVVTENAIFYSYDGTTDATAPVGVTTKGLEQGDAAWTAMGGNAAAVSITNDSTTTDHLFYVAVSASPTSVGEKLSFAFKITSFSETISRWN